MAAKAALIYESAFESVMPFSPEVRLAFFESLIKYQLYGIVPDFSEIPETAFALFVAVRPALDAAQRRHQAAIENGKKGGRPPLQKPE